MQTPTAEQRRGRVVLLEPNASLRSAIQAVLLADQYHVEVVNSLDQVLDPASEADQRVALVAWQSLQGLLAEERREELQDLTRHVRLVVMVPRHWWRLLEGTDLARVVTALIAKPFEADELLSTLQTALATELPANTVRS
jgi:DNA-binding NtrC family response regulator